jgi:hypothetical protein
VQFLVPFATRATRDAFEARCIAPDMRTCRSRCSTATPRTRCARRTSAVVASGTATLEAALARCPHVIFYRVSALTAWMVARKLLLPYVGLPNVLAGRFVVPEFLQTQATPHNLAQAALNLFDDTVTRRRLEALFAGFADELRADTGALAGEAVAQSSRRQGSRAELRHRRGGPRSSCGPVFAAAVILDPGRRIRGLRDSKVLAPERREALAVEIRAKAIAWAVRPPTCTRSTPSTSCRRRCLRCGARWRRFPWFRWRRSSTATNARACRVPCTRS